MSTDHVASGCGTAATTGGWSTAGSNGSNSGSGVGASAAGASSVLNSHAAVPSWNSPGPSMRESTSNTSPTVVSSPMAKNLVQWRRRCLMLHLLPLMMCSQRLCLPSIHSVGGFHSARLFLRASSCCAGVSLEWGSWRYSMLRFTPRRFLDLPVSGAAVLLSAGVSSGQLSRR